jgi:hypothetical protein
MGDVFPTSRSLAAFAGSGQLAVWQVVFCKVAWIVLLVWEMVIPICGEKEANYG